MARIDLDNVERKLYRIFGGADIEEVSKRRIRKPAFTEAVESSEKASEIVSLAEEALGSHGKVFAKKMDNKYVCWAVIKRVSDGMEGKKKVYHFEASFLGCAAGYEDMMDSFVEDVLMVVNEYMVFSDKVREFHIEGEIILPDESKIYGEQNSSKRILFGLTMGILMGFAFQSWWIGVMFFLIFSNLSLPSSDKKSTEKVSLKKPPAKSDRH